MAAMALSVISLALAYARLAESLPAPRTLARLVQPGEQWLFPRPRAVDRDGVLLAEYGALPRPAAGSPAALETRQLPPELVHAFLAALDPDFYLHQGVSAEAFYRALVGALRGESWESLPRSIPMRLAAQTLLPAEYLDRGGARRLLAEALLAGELSAAYSKERVLNWFLNNVPLGEMVFGVQQASWDYFGKDARELSLAQSATLAALARQPGMNPAALMQARSEILAVMQERGWVTAGQAAVARAERVVLETGEHEPGSLAALLWRRASLRLGPEALARAGLTIISTLDSGLQRGLECVVETFAETGGRLGATHLQACPQAALLPLPEPSALAEPLELGGSAAMILNPRTGEILSLWGDVERRQPLGGAAYPLVYLAAFSRGFSPGSMVLDIPQDGQVEGDERGPHGPVSLREALRNGYPLAARRLAAQLGEGYVIRLAQALGWSTSDLESWEAVGASVVEAAFGYGVLATMGDMTGAPDKADLSPYLIGRVEDGGGALLYQVLPQRSAILSPQLAYLALDVLSDPLAEDLGQGVRTGRVEGRAFLLASADGDSLHWAVGLTPERVVALWVEGDSGRRPGRSAYALLQAFLDMLAEARPAARWQRPPGVVRVRVCSPSGLLPAEGCPRTRHELFLQGTEPTHLDSAYQSIPLDRRTGARATVQTSFADLRIETFFVPPVEAQPWIGQAGLPLPPPRYSTWRRSVAGQNGDLLASPEPFSVVAGRVPILGTVRREGLKSYRLEYGRGLRPERWHLISEGYRAVEKGLLGHWQTEGLDGLYMLRLMVVREEDRVAMSWLPLVVDNEPPIISLELDPQGPSAWVRIEGHDNLGVDRVEVFLDGHLQALLREPPYIVPLRGLAVGRHVVSARIYDRAGHVEAVSQRWMVEGGAP
jgi:membrane peptidoglycan carboxypeptidase